MSSTSSSWLPSTRSPSVLVKQFQLQTPFSPHCQPLPHATAASKHLDCTQAALGSPRSRYRHIPGTAYQQGTHFCSPQPLARALLAAPFTAAERVAGEEILSRSPRTQASFLELLLTLSPWSCRSKSARDFREFPQRYEQQLRGCLSWHP